MRKIGRIYILLLTLAFLVGMVIYSYSQGLNPNTYTGRARAAAGGPATPPPGVSPEEFARFQQGNNVLSGQTATPSAPAPEIKMITVVEGELVISAKSGEVLQRPVRKQVPESLKDNYYDDGTHGDEVAGDGIYSNVVVRKDVISPTEFKERIALESLINKIAKDNPVEFYRVYVAADGHDPEIPSYSYWKQRRDEFVADFKARALAPYKDANGNFYEVYQPPQQNTPGVPQLAGQLPVQQNGPPSNNGAINNGGPDISHATNQGSQPDFGEMPATGSYFGEQNKMSK